MTKPPNNIPLNGNYRKTVDDTHNEPQDDQTLLKLSECSRPNEKEDIHLEQLLADERKKSALSEVRAGAATKNVKSLQGRLQQEQDRDPSPQTQRAILAFSNKTKCIQPRLQATRAILR
jgi:hypothetical protein